MGRPEEARRSLAWALQVSPASLPLPKLDEAATRQTAWSDLFRYPRSLLVSWLSNLGMQTTGYILWAPTLFVMLLGVSPAQASYLFIFVSLAGFVGRFVFSGLSELIGCGSRRARQAGPRVRIRLPPAGSRVRTRPRLLVSGSDGHLFHPVSDRGVLLMDGVGSRLAYFMRRYKRLEEDAMIAHPPLAQRSAKKLMNDIEDAGLSLAIELEGQCYGRLRSSDDFREGVEAFHQKRRPEFRGK